MSDGFTGSFRLAAGVALAVCLAAVPASAARPFKGRVVKLDPAIGKVTLTHGAIPKFDMPAGLTMAYRVETKSLLDGLKPGDAVTFDARDDGGSYVITDLSRSK